MAKSENESARPGVSLCVFCASRIGHDPAHANAARDIGTAIGRRGWQLVYGGGRAGLMGLMADAALAAGARVVGVIPESLMAREHGHLGLSELHVVHSMHQRKQLMAERSHAFVALPGGIGTMEELFEVWTWRQLGYHDKPVGLLNIAHYYDALLTFMRGMIESGLLNERQRDLLLVGDSVATLLDRIALLAAASSNGNDAARS